MQKPTISVAALAVCAAVAVQGCSDSGGSKSSRSSASAATTAAASTASSNGQVGITAPTGWTQVPTHVPPATGRLFDLPPNYLANGGDPVFLPSILEADRFSDRNPQTVPARLKMVVWNVEKGLDALKVEHELVNHPELANADFILLQEVPRIATNSVPAQINLARQLAQTLRMDYVLACEWDFRHSRTNGGENGSAILSKYPLGNVEQMRYQPMLNYWLTFRRLGGPLTLVSDVKVGNEILRLYNTHLMVFDFGDGRAAQAEQLAIDANLPGRPGRQIIAGDLNTWWYGSTEPVILDLKADGWSDAVASLTPYYTQLGAGFLPQLLDWAFVRGLPGTVQGSVAVSAEGADHLPLVIEFSVR